MICTRQRKKFYEDDINETLDAFASIREKLKNGIYKKVSSGVE